MAFRTDAVEIDGIRYRLRELSGLSVELAEGQPNAVRQGYALVALSLIAEDGQALYTGENLADGVEVVMQLPQRVSLALSNAVQALNGVDMDDARKN